MKHNIYAAAIIQVLENAESPVLVNLRSITEFTDAMLKSTKQRIYFKQHVLRYFTDQGYQRKRVMKNTFEIWVMVDQYELQQRELNKIESHGSC